MDDLIERKAAVDPEPAQQQPVRGFAAGRTFGPSESQRGQPGQDPVHVRRPSGPRSLPTTRGNWVCAREGA